MPHHVAIIEVPNCTVPAVFVHTDLAQLKHEVADWCKLYWVADGPGYRYSHEGLTDQQVIESYFGEDNGESCSFHETDFSEENGVARPTEGERIAIAALQTILSVPASDNPAIQRAIFEALARDALHRMGAAS